MLPGSSVPLGFDLDLPLGASRDSDECKIGSFDSFEVSPHCIGSCCQRRTLPGVFVQLWTEPGNPACLLDQRNLRGRACGLSERKEGHLGYPDEEIGGYGGAETAWFDPSQAAKEFEESYEALGGFNDCANLFDPKYYCCFDSNYFDYC